MIPIILDEKKCGNLKQTIKYLQEKLREHYNMDKNLDEFGQTSLRGGRKDESGDEIHLVVPGEESSDSSDSDLEVARRNEDVEMYDEHSSQFISSLVEPSYQLYSG